MKPGESVTLTLRRGDLKLVISGLGFEVERWRKRTRTLKPDGSAWTEARANVALALDIKDRALRLLGHRPGGF